MVDMTTANGANGSHATPAAGSTSASAVFLRVLLESGITTAFVNLGSVRPRGRRAR